MEEVNEEDAVKTGVIMLDASDQEEVEQEIASQIISANKCVSTEGSVEIKGATSLVKDEKVVTVEHISVEEMVETTDLEMATGTRPLEAVKELTCKLGTDAETRPVLPKLEIFSKAKPCSTSHAKLNASTDMPQCRK